MYCKVRIILFMVGNEVGWVAILLAKPAVPEVFDALLIPRRSDDPQSVKVYSTLDDVSRYSLLSVDEDRIPLEKGME